MSEHDNSPRTIFLAALEIEEPQQRAAFLSHSCGADLVLREEVEALLQAEATAGNFLPDHPAAGASHAALLQAAGALDPGHDLRAPHAEQLGDRLGRYRLLQKIGEGGCGVVYMAEQEEPVRRKVALKVIKLGMDTRNVMARFDAERQALALMDHPHIAKVFDAGATETGRPFFVMELVRGTKLTDYCDQNQVSTRERLELFISICQAIQHAHQKGIIHRDIKPSNILVTVNDGVAVPKVIDFGIAKATEGRLTDQTLFTAFEQFLGTPAYMSPEQTVLTSLDIDTRSDIYSLGVLLYELLTGKTPFDTKVLLASGLDELRRTIREKEPERPSTRLSTMLAGELDTVARQRQTEAPKLIHLVRGDLDWIVMKCLEKDRGRRYETANGLAMDIRRHLNCEPVVARPPSRLYEFQKTVRRHNVGFAATAAVIVVLAAGITVSTWQAVRARRAEREQSRLHEAEQQARRKADAQERIARQRAYAADMNLAQQALAVNNFALAQDLLSRESPEAGQEELRDWEWRYLWQFCQSDGLYELCRKSNAISSLAVSADGKWIAIGENRGGGLSVLDLRTRQQVASLQAGKGEVVTAFSPRYSLLAFSTAAEVASANSHDNIRFWDPETKRMVGQELRLPGPCRGIAFARDGQTLYTFTTDDQLTLWRVPEGEKLRSFHAPLQRGLTPPLATAVASDGSFAAHATPGGWIRTLDLVTGNELWTVKAANEFVEALAVSPDGSVIASSGEYGGSDIRLWHAASGEEIGSPLKQGGWISTLVFWPDGKKLASAGENIRLWDVRDPGQVRPIGRPIHGHREGIWRLALLPDQSTLVSGSQDGSVWVWDAAVSRPEPKRATLPALLAAWRFAPDSQSILALDQRGQVAKWEGSRFQECRPLFEIGTNILQANFSQDGRWLAVAPTNGLIQVWDTSRGDLAGQFASTTKRMPFNSPGLLFLTQRKKLLILDEDDKLHEWDLTSLRETRWWPSPVGTMTLAVSSDETLCVTLGRSGKSCPCSIRNMVTGHEETMDLDLSDVEDCAFSPDAKLFAAVSSAGGAKVWETSSLRQTAALAFLESTFSVCFSPNSRRIVTGGGNKAAVQLWDPESGQKLLTLEGESTFFWPTAFSPDGNTLASMNYKGLLHLWRAPSWAEIALAERHQQSVSKP